MALFLITVTVFCLVIFLMAIGVLMGRGRIKGSCGGLGACDACPFNEGESCEGDPPRKADCPHAEKN
jgi:hypothetical protein